MVVVLAAVCAYRYHRSKQQQQAEQEAVVAVVKDGEPTTTTTSLLSEHWQRTTEPLRRSSSDLVRTAFACHYLPNNNSTHETTTTTTEDDESYSYSAAAVALDDDDDWRAAPSTSGTSRSTGSLSRRRQRRRRKNHSGHHHVIVPQLSNNNNNNMIPLYAAQVFQPNVRQRWIDAVFGSDFCQNNNTATIQRQGTGNANIASYVTYSCTIPITESSTQLGLTLSKLALGLYVRKTAEQSEARSAGIVEGSILVSVNSSMNLLGEPSQQALERMWQYEGFLENITTTTVKKRQVEPISLTLYHPQGYLYTAVLFTSPFGISWAPCGHFALVQRVYGGGAAQAAGVRRGSLLAAIVQDGDNKNSSLRQLTDHVDWGMRLQEYSHHAQTSSSLKMILCYPPAASRSSHYERLQKEEKGGALMNQTKKSRLPGTRTDDGIEVRVHPLEYSIRSLWTNNNSSSSPTSAAGGGGSPKSCGTDESAAAVEQEEEQQQQPNSITELARQVVTAQVLAPTRRQEASKTKRFASDKRYSSCPPFPGIVQEWGALDALVYCLRFYKVSYHDVLEPNQESSLTTLQRMGTNTCQPFLLSCVGLLCQSDDGEGSDSLVEYGKKVMAVLLTIALGDEDFCQRLHFVLRSFCMSLQDNGPALLVTARERLAKQMSNDPTRVPVTSQRRGRVASEEEGVESIDIQETGSAIPIQSGTPKKKKGVFRKLKRKDKKKGTQEEEIASVATAPTVNIKDDPKSSTLVVKPVQPEYHSLPELLENTTQFVSELDNICDTIERTLLRSISQKIADWALQPWSPGKETVLAEVTQSMREDLVSKVSKQMPSMNPVDSSEVLVSLDPEGCYILPSAHFPLLLTLNVEKKSATRRKRLSRPEEKLYRTKVEILGLRGAGVTAKNPRRGINRSYFVGASVAGAVKETRRSVTKDDDSSEGHFWDQASLLSFDSRSSWGAPQTLSLRLSSVDTDERGREVISHADEFGALRYASDLGYCWIDLKPLWDKADSESRSATSARRVRVFSDDSESDPQPFELQIKVTTEYVDIDDATTGHSPRQRMLLYKHDDDLRQEMFAVEFVRTCDALLKASGLDLRLLTFECVPVGEQRGFVEWIPGSVPLSELCRSPLSDSEDKGSEKKDVASVEQSLSEVARAGFSKYQPLRRPRRAARSGRLSSDNAIQDFLRSVAYDPNEQYLIQKEIMDTYIKSCAGYCVISYVLGVGDRHLDNLLLHQTGHFFHCDFSFLLGRDPKQYLPMRITEAMVEGMGGKESDGYAMFLSLAGAAFCVLRRHENVRVMLALVRTLASANLPDVSVQQTVDQATQSMMDRLRLDLSDADAITFIEETIETSISSKMWLAVDAMHSIGKRL